MGTEDMARQALNVARMRMLGTQVVGVDSGSVRSRTPSTKPCAIGSPTSGPRHYLSRLRPGRASLSHDGPDFQSVIGREAREQILAAEKTPAHASFACVGGGSNSSASFTISPRRRRKDDRHQAGGRGGELGEHAVRLARIKVFLERGLASSRAPTLSFANEDGQIATTHSISADSTIPPSAPSMLACRSAPRRIFRRLRSSRSRRRAPLSAH